MHYWQFRPTEEKYSEAKGGLHERKYGEEKYSETKKGMYTKENIEKKIIQDKREKRKEIFRREIKAVE